MVILLTATYIAKPLEFAAFPSLLLVTTLFRLSLNVASTRLILLHGTRRRAAGKSSRPSAISWWGAITWSGLSSS